MKEQKRGIQQIALYKELERINQWEKESFRQNNCIDNSIFYIEVHVRKNNSLTWSFYSTQINFRNTSKLLIFFSSLIRRAIKFGTVYALRAIKIVFSRIINVLNFSFIKIEVLLSSKQNKIQKISFLWSAHRYLKFIAG